MIRPALSLAPSSVLQAALQGLPLSDALPHASRIFTQRAKPALPVTALVHPLLAPRTASPLAPADANLTAALATVDPEQIKKDVYWVADDARGGRATPSKGQTQTAQYIVDRLKQTGWAPAGGPGGDYLYHYKTWGGGFFKTEAHDAHGLTEARAPNDNTTKLTFDGGGISQDFAYGKDYFYSALGNRTDLEVTGDLVTAGFGMAREFTDIDARGKWVVCYDNPLVSPEERRLFAKEAGARGLIILPNPTNESPYYNQRIQEQARLAAEGGLNYPLSCDFDEITLTPEGANRFAPLYQTLNEDSSGLGFTPNTTSAVTLHDKRVLAAPFGQIEADNVAGFWKGSDPELSKEVILITAHYDHVGTGRNGAVYNGADDNGSGTSSLLALAEAIAKLNPKRSIMLMWVSGEELGLLGSQAWVENPYFPEGVTPVADINMDMVGRNADAELYITPSKAHKRYNGITKLFESLSDDESFDALGSADEYYTRSDHYNFTRLKDKNGRPIPIVFITTGMHPDYHKPSDDPDKINYPKMARNIRLVLRVLNEMQGPSLPQ